MVKSEDGCEDGGVDGVVDSGLDGEQVKFGYNIKVLNINRQQASMCLTATLFLMTGIWMFNVCDIADVMIVVQGFNQNIIGRCSSGEKQSLCQIKFRAI